MNSQLIKIIQMVKKNTLQIYTNSSQLKYNVYDIVIYIYVCVCVCVSVCVYVCVCVYKLAGA